MLLKLLPAIVISFSAESYAQVHQSDLNAWNRIYIQALDEHPLWSKIPYIRTIQKDLTEKRVYVNRVPNINNKACLEKGVIRPECQKQNPCLKGLVNPISEAQMNEYFRCSENQFGCDNIFVIDDQLVLSYSTVGYCKTDKTTRPAAKYKPIPEKQEVINPIDGIE